MYGFEDEIVSVSGGKFGLNQKAFMTKFELVTYGDSNKEALDVTFMVDAKEFRSRFFPVERVYDKNRNEITDKNSNEYKEAATQAGKTLSATLVSIVRCFVSDEKLRLALKTPFATFAEYVQVLVKVLNDNPMWNVEEIDLFLEWQNKPKEGQDKSWLQVPKDTRQGSFVCKSVKGTFTEVKSDAGIIYKDEQGNVHPFKRNKWYLDSAYANRTDNSVSKEAPTFNSTPEEPILW